MISKKLKNIALTALISASLIAGMPLKNAKADDSEYINRIKGMSYTQVMKEIKTPAQAEKYLTTFLSYKKDRENFRVWDYAASFKRIHKNKSDDCDGGSLAAAALLSDDGYPPLQLIMYIPKVLTNTNLRSGHAVFIYQENGKWGTLGIDKMDCQKPKYSSIEDIVKHYEYFRFGVINIAEQYPDYTNNNKNMKKSFRMNLTKPIK